MTRALTVLCDQCREPMPITVGVENCPRCTPTTDAVSALHARYGNPGPESRAEIAAEDGAAAAKLAEAQDFAEQVYHRVESGGMANPASDLILARDERVRAETLQRCNGSCDIALARRQVGPDGVVPGNARECAELWEREAARLCAVVRALGGTP